MSSQNKQICNLSTNLNTRISESNKQRFHKDANAVSEMLKLGPAIMIYSHH